MNVLLKHRNHLGYVSIKAYQIAKVKQKNRFLLKSGFNKDFEFILHPIFSNPVRLSDVLKVFRYGQLRQTYHLREK